MLTRLVSILILTTLFCMPGRAQEHFRFKAGFSVKQKTDSSAYLIMGTVYYDKNIGKVVYDIYFPDRQVWVQNDTALFRFRNDSLIGRDSVNSPTEFTVFHLCLSNRLNNYGLNEEAGFRIDDLERRDTMTVTTWEPSTRQTRKRLGDVKIAQVRGRIYAVAFYTPDDDLAGRQFFNGYTVIDGLEVPHEVIHLINVPDGPTIRRITTFRDVELDQIQTDEDLYDYSLPDSP